MAAPPSEAESRRCSAWGIGREKNKGAAPPSPENDPTLRRHQEAQQWEFFEVL
jgi:hypothetical protein